VRRLPRIPLIAATVGAAALGAAACGEKGISASSQYRAGAELFAQRCSGCHTLSAAGTEGSAENVRSKLRTQGPNLDQRIETVANVLFAIRNGGFSGAIMPQNVVVGTDAQQVAAFVAHYAGSKRKVPPSPKGGGAASNSTGGTASP
jgi:mono/diheme cytochrome c family protein